MGEKRINLTCPIRNLDSSKEVVIVSMFSDNIQYWINEPLKVLLIMNEEKYLLTGMLTSMELNRFVRRKVITTPLDTNKNVFKTDELVGITEMALSLDELDNTDNLEDGRLSNVLLNYHMTGSDMSMHFEPIEIGQCGFWCSPFPLSKYASLTHLCQIVLY